MEEVQFYQATISFEVRGKKKEFQVVHNLGEDIDNAVKSWVQKTDPEELNIKSLCRFIIEKDPKQFTCMTLEKWEELKQKAK